MAQLTPYLFFSGSAKDAMAFYKDVFGGDLTINLVGDSPAAAQMPPEAKDNVMHSQLKNEHITIMASDMMDGDKADMGNMMTMCMICTSKEEIERLFNRLAEGGSVTDPLKEEFFGTFGRLTDRFGVHWMFQFGMDGQK